jgi:hypothetical protein
MKRSIALVLCALSALPAASLAQGVWRCGADGKSYSDSPCPGGKSLEVTAARPAADVAAARAMVQRQLAWAQATKASREKEERQLVAASSVPANIGAVARPAIPDAKAKAKPVKPKAQRHPAAQKRRAVADDGTWQATVPATPRKKG